MDKMIKGTETEKSLLKAFAGESQAKNRYTFFSEIAKKEGYEQIAGRRTRRGFQFVSGIRENCRRGRLQKSGRNF